MCGVIASNFCVAPPDAAVVFIFVCEREIEITKAEKADRPLGRSRGQTSVTMDLHW